MQFLIDPGLINLSGPSVAQFTRTSLVYIAAVIFVLGVLVFIHELGHFVMAKLFNVKVEVFSLGFGKRLVGFRHLDTDYRISLLPLGGFVKMAGDNPMEDRKGDPGEFMSHPRWQRFLIAIAGPAMNIILAIAVLAGVFMYQYDFPGYLKRPVDVVFMDPGSPAEKAGLQLGDRITKVQAVQNPTWEQFLITVSISPNQPVNVTVQRDGKSFDTTLVPQEKGRDRIGDVGLNPPEVVGMVERGPAQKAGIRPGDVLVNVNGTAIKGVPDLLSVMQHVKDSPLQLQILRDGQPLTLTVTPQLLDTPGSPQKKYRMGMLTAQIGQLPFTSAVSHAYEDCKDNSLLIFELMGKMVQRKVPIQQLSGPIGIMQASGEAAMDGWPTLLRLMALISINLAVVNLFPIPILDGGLMLMLLIEAVMRRDIKQQVKERVYQTAFVFLLLFFAVVIYNDVAKSLGHF
jgi:regulator of sigma E protease